jgi:hypothetical protein
MASLDLQKWLKPEWELMGPAEYIGSSASEEISGALWDSEVYYLIHKSQPLVRLLN